MIFPGHSLWAVPQFWVWTSRTPSVHIEDTPGSNGTWRMLKKKRFKNNNIAAIKWFRNSPIKLFSDRIISNVILPCCTKNHIKSPIYIVIATKDQLEETEKICWFKFQLRHKMRPHHLHQRSMDHPTAGAENLKANSRHDTTVEPTKTWNSPTSDLSAKKVYGCLWMFMVHASNILNPTSVLARA
jgi:hypothetical protein